MNITLSKGGKGERVENLETLVIHDLWGAAQRHPSKLDREYILEVWHLANDLKRELIECDRRNAELLEALKLIVTREGGDLPAYMNPAIALARAAIAKAEVKP